MGRGQERSECRQRLLSALSALGPRWEMAEFALDPEDFGPGGEVGSWYGENMGKIWGKYGESIETSMEKWDLTL